MSSAESSVVTESNAAAAPVLSGIIPYLTVGGAAKASEFYAQAFNAKEVARHPLDDQGRTMHIHLHLNNASLMLSDAYPEHGYPLQPIQGFTINLAVTDIDSWYRRAVDAGCEILLPLQKMFWGDMYCQLRDPFGVMWSMNQAAGCTETK